MRKVSTKKITSIGGSALIEGIMMRGPKRTTVCVRTGENEIYSEDIKMTTIPEKCKLFKLPLLRGIAGLIDSMRLSYKSLMLSADKAVEAGEVEEEEPEEQQIFQVVEEMPEFPGGMAECLKFIGKNIKYPTIAQENGVQGRVIIQFVVNQDGSIVDPVVVRSVDPYLDKEALRVIKTMPKWKPGKQRGKAVRVKYTVPVTFKLQ